MLIEQRKAIQRLQQLKQKQTETIANHTTNWMAHMHDVPRIKDVISKDARRDLYVQSLHDNGLVATLTATIIMNDERNNNVSLKYICKIAMEIGTRIVPIHRSLETITRV